jgi:hypothetical protein
MTAMRTPRTMTPNDLERCAIWEEIGTEGGALRWPAPAPAGCRSRRVVEVPPGSFASGRLDGFCFARRPPFASTFAALNRNLLARRLGYVR